MNQTEGNVVAHPADHPLVKGTSSTATTALGRILATGNHHGVGTNPKGSSKGTDESPTPPAFRWLERTMMCDVRCHGSPRNKSNKRVCVYPISISPRESG